VLRVVLPSIAPTSAVAIQWLRNGVPVAGATGRTYQVGASDLGTRLLARLRLTRTGYTPVSVASTPTPLVRSTPVLQVTATAGVRALALNVTVRAAGVRPVQGVLAVRSRGGFDRELTIRNGVVRTTLANLPSGSRKFRFRVLPSTMLTTVMVARRVTVR
jgi:hypothetical protein